MPWSCRGASGCCCRTPDIQKQWKDLALSINRQTACVRFLPQRAGRGVVFQWKRERNVDLAGEMRKWLNAIGL
jgi:hypothetical protein